MSKRVLFTTPFLLLAQLAHAEEPQWLIDARAREGAPQKLQTVKSEDGFFKAKAPAKVLNKIEEDEGSYTITLDIGSETPANCEVIRNGFDLGSILRATSELTFKEVEPIQGQIEQRAIERTDAGVFGSTPYVALEWVYRVNDGKAARLGGLKQISMVKGGYGLYCAHIDIGYAKTFQNVAKSLAETLEFSDEAAAPYFVEISTAKLGAAKVGVAIVTMERDEEGDSKLQATTSLVMPVTADTLRTQDASHIQWVRPDGSLINASHVVSENGEIETNLALDWTDEEKWLVKGAFNGKEIEKAIAGDRDPETWIEQAQARRQLFGQQNIVGRKFAAPQWTIADPTRFIDSQTKIVSVIDNDRIAARETLGGVSMDVVLDRSTGMPSKAVMQVGPQSLELERVYINGAF